MGRKAKYRKNKNEKESRRDKNSKDFDLPKNRLKMETRYTITALLLSAVAIFFVLASLNFAGPVGNFTYNILDKLFGTGFFLIPILLLFLGYSFLKLNRPNILPVRFLSGFVAFVAGLAMVCIVFGEIYGGIVGKYLSRPLVNLFDVYFSIIILTCLLVASLFVIFDTHLTLEKKLFWYRFGKRDELDDDEEEEDDEEMAVEVEVEETEEPTKEDEKPGKEAPAPIITGDKNKDENSFLSGFINFGKNKSSDTYIPPPLSLLEKDSGKPNVGDIKANSNIIKRTLANFGINVEMDEISIGPSITRYALKPAEGVKLSRIVALQNDLSLSLAAHPLRIEAPIPGKALVGIEIPNKVKSIVGLANLIGAKEFQESNHPLTLALGRGISGTTHYANLAKAPHMLIAGATGSGKSVAIHTLIASLLYRNSPEDMRFIMIDPKRVELTLYNKIPHLLTPVVTNAKKAILALKWAAKEMDRRYDILESESVRDIQSYHKNVVRPYLDKISKQGADESEGDSAEAPERMPYIVIIIDELADIMTAYPRELEAAIVRLAQMSRAVGIHLVLSTQRPSVEVITGLIKANIPSRVAMQVASQIDSRTIIDMAGAEKLLGAGDMLYISGEMSKPVRLQSAFISEDEVKKIVGHLAHHYANELPTSEINLDGEEKSDGIFSTALDSDGDDDDLYEDARMAVIEAKKASASYLQRKLKVGYARAARLLDMLEERGVIGPGEGAKPRDVFEQGGQATSEDDYQEAPLG